MHSEIFGVSIARAASNPIACAVKRADIADNNNPERLAVLDTATVERLRRKYAETLRILNAGSTHGSVDGH